MSCMFNNNYKCELLTKENLIDIRLQIFYPDLINKSEAPEYFLVCCAD